MVTKPTQAQIEAAARAIMKTTYPSAEAQAKAALTAAAEVGTDPPVCRLQFPDGTVPGNAREAAEGWRGWYEQTRDDLKQFSGAAADEMLRLEHERNDIEAATIERCAQKIDNMIEQLKRSYDDPRVSPAMREMGKIRVEALQEAAASIRALKDKP